MRMVLFIMLAGSMLVSCNHQSNETGYFDYAEFLERKAAWEELNIDHYDFMGGTHGFSAGPPRIVTVTVFPDKEPLIERSFADQGPYPIAYPFFPVTNGVTITEVFEGLDLFYHDRINDSSYIHIVYDEEYHFPTNVRILPRGAEPDTNRSGPGLVMYSFRDLRENR